MPETRLSLSYINSSVRTASAHSVASGPDTVPQYMDTGCFLVINNFLAILYSTISSPQISPDTDNTKSIIHTFKFLVLASIPLNISLKNIFYLMIFLGCILCVFSNFPNNCFSSQLSCLFKLPSDIFI